MHKVEGREKTTSEIYQDFFVEEILNNLQAGLISPLLISHNRLKNLKLLDHLKTKIQFLLTYTPTLEGFSLPLTREPSRCHLIFNYAGSQPNYFGIQTALARESLRRGFRSGIVQRFPGNSYEVFERRFFSLGGAKLRRYKRLEISEASDYLLFLLSRQYKLEENELKTYRIKLIYWATTIEKQAQWLKRKLEIYKVKLGILMYERNIYDLALQIACQETGTPSMLVPHGWPQKIWYPITSSFVTSFCYHHDQYLKTLCLKPNQVLGMGWLEPSVTLGSNLINLRKEKASTNKIEKQHILFFSQMHGKNHHRCASLVDYIPHILKALDKMNAVETITLRLHPAEGKNPDNKEFLSQCNCSKLRLFVGKPIAEDLQASTMLMAFSSKALMYGPYLNMKAVEIRDEAINAEWGGTVLPPEQVYQIKGEFNPDEFCDFVANVPTLRGEDVFYNYGRELEAFGDFLQTML